jgi:uncharacterized protein (TIGR00290 family)
MKNKIILSWSGGKDCALACYLIQDSGDYEIVALLTTITEDYDRVSMHGVRRNLIEQQAESLGLSLETVFIPAESTNKEYELRVGEVLSGYKEHNVTAVAFGDVFLEDVRRYREENLARAGMEAVFPLWGRETAELIGEFMDMGFEAIITCVDSRMLGPLFLGKRLDRDLLSRLPSGVDIGGENGEFHSFVFDGPIFTQKINVSVGEVVLRDSFYFCDLLPEEETNSVSRNNIIA